VRQADCFRHAWRSGSAALLSVLRGAHWGCADTLLGVSWRVLVPLASDAPQQPEATPAQPVAVLELQLGPAGGPAAGERLAFECSRDQLASLFDDVERIQAQLDALAT